MLMRFCGKPARYIAIIVAIVTAICVSTSQSKAATPYPDAATARFSVTVTGSGPDVILIPGLASSAAVWDGTVTHLKDHYRLHVLNLAGFAGEPAAANATGDVLAPSVEALDAYIKNNHLNKPVVVGHSLGGLMSLMLAKAHPEDAGKLVIVDALPYVGVIFNPAATVDMLKPTATTIRDTMIGTPVEAFKNQQALTLQNMVTASADQATVLDWSMTSDRRVLAQSFYEDLTLDLRPDVPAITTPTTLIYPVSAGQNAEITDAIYKSNYATKPAMTFSRIDNSRHFIMLDQPDIFYQALDAALR